MNAMRIGGRADVEIIHTNDLGNEARAFLALESDAERAKGIDALSDVAFDEIDAFMAQPLIQAALQADEDPQRTFL